MVGRLVLEYALADDGVRSVMTVGRRPTGIEHPKLREISHTDFMDFSAVRDALSETDVALYCLGVYTGAVPDAELRQITVDYTVAFADALAGASPGATFCFLSGQAADPSGRSRMAFARYKGGAESALEGMGFPRLHIFRPGYIYPVTPRTEPNFTYRLMRAVYPAVRRLYPNIGIRSDDLARAMFVAGLRGTPGHASSILENRDIRNFVGATS
jgi:uncharacterized protein YbjT (DUF2867 family)